MGHRNCHGAVVTLTCPAAECPDTPEITLQNVNLAGIGTLDGWSSPLGNFRGVEPGNAMVTVTLNNTNHTIVITPVAAAIAAALPAATTTQVGVLETATDAEAIAKSATNKLITPSNFAAMGASTTFAGLIEIATQQEVIDGVSTTLAVTPAGINGLNFFSLANNAANDTEGEVAVNITAGSITYFGSANITGITLNDCFLNFVNNAGIQFGAGPIADILLGTDQDGYAVSYLISNFLSTENVTAYGAPTGILTRTTFAGVAPTVPSVGYVQAEAAAVANTVSILSQRLAALITDLQATIKPS